MRTLYALYRAFLFSFAYLWYIFDAAFDKLNWGEVKRFPIRILFIVIYPLLWIVIVIISEIFYRKKPNIAASMVLHAMNTADMNEVFTGSVDKAAREAAKNTIED